MNNEHKGIVQVKPDIIYPYCIKSGEQQDCFNCDLHKSDLCKSPRRLCVKSYHAHKKGCPNYAKRIGCPPNLRMFDEYFDISKPIYAIYTTFDIESHINKMSQRHPNWTERQCRNVLYWQGTARKRLKEYIKEFNKKYSQEGYIVTRTPEGMGVNITSTMNKVGILLEWPPKKLVYTIAFAGILKISIDEFNNEAI